jgi:PleD family two-component response regulator
MLSELENILNAYSRASSHVTISIGFVSMIPQAGLNQNILVEMTDKAIYHAKKMGRNQIHVFTPMEDPS